LEQKTVLLTHNTKETIHLGKRMGMLLQPGDTVALVGELGTGKTHYIKGVAAGLGVERADRITSPSFTLIHEYRGRFPFYHIDLFRLGDEEEAEELGLEEVFAVEGVVAVEWADRIPNLLPEELLWVELVYIEKQTRSISLHGRGKRYEGLVREASRDDLGR
jgi:tRNA threonylcarbamoyladenosine biosynthesis protein TsaE